MDVDAQTDQPENNTEASGINEEIASSSNGHTNALLKEASKNSMDLNVSLGEESTNLQSVSTAVSGGIMLTQDVEGGDRNREARNNFEEEQQQQATDDAVGANVIGDDELQNEQHIENAGIDPNYPLVLVRRASIPSSGDNSREHELDENISDDPIAMDQENSYEAEYIIDGASPLDLVALFNSISGAGSKNEDDEDIECAFSGEDEDEAYTHPP